MDDKLAARADRPVRRRVVFYLPGYDPFPPRRYRELYRKEGARQAEISGYSLALTPRAGRDEPYGWDIEIVADGSETRSRIHILHWTDIVRQSMNMGVLATYLLLVRTFWIYLSTGVMTRLFRLRKGPVITAMYPVVMLLGQLAVALGLAGLIWWLAAQRLPHWVALPLGLVVVPPVLWKFRQMDGKLFVYYLLHDYAFTARHLGENPPELEQRMAAFVALIGAALSEDVDEVLVVGHSSGVHLGVSILADVIRAGHCRPDGPLLAFLSLGQAVPMQSFLPDAARLRADLHYLSERDEITWIDISAPADGCCYALCDPVAVSGAAGPGKRWPLVLSAAFSQTLLPETWARLRRRFFRLHFQYLCAFDKPGDYDYFLITGGPRSLAARFAGRQPSAQRKETVLSPHLGRAPE
ncbi:hypothetical protein ACFQXB_07840 [Plastorhodobacter daqingensis]|uniref:Alpha/beta hydrolase n=1 Tax=Plastorhodobacter daqingensis TaxID=1387281 RepID=A0ABW2UHF0_9RHOB